MDIDLYQYYLGREDQSVNEKVLISRIEQQIKVTKIVAECTDLKEVKQESPKLANYMCRNVSIMMAISSIHLLLFDEENAKTRHHEIWAELKKENPGLYYRLRYTKLGGLTNLSGKLGKKATVNGYRMANKIVREIIHAKGIDIGIYTKDFENEYISLTDISKYRNDNDPRFVIQNWMRNRNTVEFLAVWEELHNPDFNRVQFEAVRSETGLNRFVMTPTKWIEQTNAIGIVSKAGRYGGGTYAHSDIAMAFATWISPEFQLYIMKDYRRLKQDENSRFSLDWNLNRALSKVNYRIHTDAVKENLIPPELTPEQIAYTYASEADLLNVALFGQTAKQWKNNNPGKKGNVRDDANLNQLLVLANMESYNAILIEQGKSQSERLILLRNLAIRQMDTLVSINLSAVSALPGGDM